MDIQHGKITLWLGIAIAVLSTGLISHVMAIPVLLDIAGRDAWISILIAAPIYILWLLLYVYYLRRLDGEPFLKIVDDQWGKWVGWILKIVFGVLLLFNAMYTMLDTMIWTVTTYLQETPFSVITVTAIFVCVLMAYNGLQSIAIVASFLLPVVGFLGYFVAIVNTKHKDWSLLLPMLDHGILPPIQGSLYVLSALMDFWIIILFANRVKKQANVWQSILLALFLIMMVMGPTTGALTEFGPSESMRQRHTAFDQWKILTIGQFFQHVDFLSIFQWLSGSIVRISISLCLLTDLFAIHNKKYRFLFLTGCGVASFIFILQRWRDDLMLAFLKQVYFPYLLCFVVILTIFIGITISIKRRKEQEQDE